MPSFPPRTEPVKKQNQLAQRKQELELAIQKDFSKAKLLKQIDKFKLAKLSVLKAQIRQIKEKEFGKKPTTLKIEKIEKEIIKWLEKTNEDILNEVKSKLKIH